MNKHNPELKLPKHEPAGDWLVTYDADRVTSLDTMKPPQVDTCNHHSCLNDAKCHQHQCKTCESHRVENGCKTPLANAVGLCHQKKFQSHRHKTER